jgi:hypothetical protein
MATPSCDRGQHFEGRPKNMGGTFLQRATFGRSGHRAPQISLRFIACLRGQLAVISSNQS